MPKGYQPTASEWLNIHYDGPISSESKLGSMLERDLKAHLTLKCGDSGKRSVNTLFRTWKDAIVTRQTLENVASVPSPVSAPSIGMYYYHPDRLHLRVRM